MDYSYRLEVHATDGADELTLIKTRAGFDTVTDATLALFDALGAVACHWGEMSEEGAVATGYVRGDGYQDTYTIEMG